MPEIDEPQILWEPSDKQKASSQLVDFMRWLENNQVATVEDYQSLWEWSVKEIRSFWESLWHYCGVKSSKSYERVLEGTEMPHCKWFVGAELNYVENIFLHYNDNRSAIIFRSEHVGLTKMSWRTLKQQVANVAASLRAHGVVKGDRVVAYVPNIPQAVVAMLATASIGAIWSSCSPDFGVSSAVNRFKQIEPKVLFAVDGYYYGGRSFDKLPALKQLQDELPSLTTTVLIPYLNQDIDTTHDVKIENWNDWEDGREELVFEQVSFSHPLWILYSSGTTGIPKAIVHSHGGILLEQLKSQVLHHDTQPGDRFFWFTTTGWMMWNFLIGALLSDATIILYDGNPFYPNKDVLWKFAEETNMTFFGTSAAYLSACMKSGMTPAIRHNLNSLRSIGSTGSPLPAECFQWVYENVKRDISLGPVSGGTDLCTAFVGVNPLGSVRSGEMMCRYLGADIQAYSHDGKQLYNQMGELVIQKPMPSMPLFFWGDTEGTRYRESYFGTFLNTWRHGDWILIRPDGRNIIFGRSDSTINRAGVRMGTSEIYDAVESLDEIVDSLVVDLELLGRTSFLPLFVVLKGGSLLTEQLKDSIKKHVRISVSPRHVPDEIYSVSEIPRTLNGKKLEIPIRKILLGSDVGNAVNLDSVANPKAIDYFVEFGKTL